MTAVARRINPRNTIYNSHLVRNSTTETITTTKTIFLDVKTKSSWYLDRINELNALKLLDSSWKDGDLDPPNDKALFWADCALDCLRILDFSCTRISPSVDEGVVICFISGDKYADLEFFNTGEILAVISSRKSSPTIWTVLEDPADIYRAIDSIRDYIQR